METETKQFIVLDTETTGLPKTPRFGAWYSPSETHYYTSSRVIQVAVVSSTESHVWLIRPENFSIKNSEFHGITQEMALGGVSWNTMITELMDILKRYDVIVGHNILFDINVLAAELYKRDQLALASELLAIPYECTMFNGKMYMNTYRYPKLTVLYEYLFQEQINQKHDALEDCCITYDCYIRMKNLDRARKYTFKKNRTEWKELVTIGNKGIEYGKSIVHKIIGNIKQ